MDTSYRTSLGPIFLGRARIIFGVLTVLVLTFTIAGIYQGINSGDFSKSLVQPFRQFAADFKAATEEQPATPAATLQYVPVAIDTPEPAPQEQTTYTQPAPAKTYSQPAQQAPAYDNSAYQKSIQDMNAKAEQQYQDALKQQQAWADQQKAAGQAWLQQQSQQNDAAAKAQFDADVQKMQQDTEAWKKAHGF